MSRRMIILTLAGLFTFVSVGTVLASHRWGCWKYYNYYIWWNNAGGGDYWNIYNEEAKSDSNSWQKYTDVYFRSTSYGNTDHINAYSGSYGSTGWLGVAEIRSSSGCIIKEGRTRLNHSYLANYSRTAKKHVACQEVGHLLGLHHNTSANNTCMNDQILSAPYPNSHDRSLVNSIY